LTPAPSLEEVLAALRGSHDWLVEVLQGLTDDQLSGQSYDTEWSIAQVASHLGSGAEVFTLFLEAGVERSAAPRIEQMHPIWDRWNARSAPEQARDFVTADGAFLDRIDSFSDEERERWQLDMFGTDQSLTGLLRMRLAEHAVHSWDVIVALDPAATIAEGPTALVIDNLSVLVERVGKPLSPPVTVAVRTTTPERHLRLELTPEGARLSPAGEDPSSTAVLRLPAEAFVRLLYGRLDPGHTPASVALEGIELDTLRRAFPGV
jgi:uncharacterized protein (TIGR03083 family)